MEPLKKLAVERQKLKGKGVNRSHSLYWDILFLAFTVIGRENIDHGKGTQTKHSQVSRLRMLKLHFHFYSAPSWHSTCA
jgi:hypothetical protein